ncbi:hypothetical protein PTE30175_00077 [Pandoraea terrae]|uniref:Uncharacterized protein n=1 Tax=Pandoraea terrae TaxID=1537710 RepID=A0A5E4RDG7_9BURK|nr:hypothetical protein PTE30175_00077 [Pandoraea terrae]
MAVPVAFAENVSIAESLAIGCRNPQTVADGPSIDGMFAHAFIGRAWAGTRLRVPVHTVPVFDSGLVPAHLILG